MEIVRVIVRRLAECADGSGLQLMHTQSQTPVLTDEVRMAERVRHVRKNLRPEDAFHLG